MVLGRKQWMVCFYSNPRQLNGCLFMNLPNEFCKCWLLWKDSNYWGFQILQDNHSNITYVPFDFLCTAPSCWCLLHFLFNGLFMVTLSRPFFLEFFFFTSCHSETSHAVLELIAHSLCTIYLLDLCFWVTVWLASPLWGNSFVLVYNWLPSCFIWLNSISQEVLGYLAFFTSFNRCFRTVGSLSLWNEVTKEKCPLWHHHNSFN